MRTFFYRLRRSWSWFVFTWKQNPWQEDYQLFEVIEKVLLDTANYFEDRERKGRVVGVDNAADIQDMRLAAKLIRMKIDEVHLNQLHEETGYVFNGDAAMAAMHRDDRCLETAMKILAQKGFQWWI